MNKLLNILLLTLCTPLTFIKAEDRRSPEIKSIFYKARHDKSIKRYLGTYPAPIALQELINHEPANYSYKNGFYRSHGFYFKRELDRLDGAAIMRKVIAQKNYDLLFVPQKYALGSEDHACVVAQIVSNLCEKSFNRVQIEQLCGLIKKTYFWDAHAGNIIPMKDGRIAIVDTELLGFGNSKDTRINGMRKMKRSLFLTNDAREYLKQEMKKEKARNAIDEWFQRPETAAEIDAWTKCKLINLNGWL